MNSHSLFQRYQELQRYVGWSDEDASRLRSLAPVIETHFEALVNDFYEEIERHPQALEVITGGADQIQRLKDTLKCWLEQLFSGVYDAEYVWQRWRIGYRHVEIGLDQIYTNMALARLRRGLLEILERDESRTSDHILRSRISLNTMLDLDLALIEDAYQTEYTFRKEATERLALIGQVAGGVAHELRNPLNVIKTSVFYLLNARNPPPEKAATHLARIERQVELADEVIVALTNFAKMALPIFHPFSVEAVFASTVQGNELPASIRVSIDCPADLIPAYADSAQIRIVLDNLIRNAIDAMGEGGTLQLSARQVEHSVEMRVADNGRGIPPEDLARIMEPFYSTKARGIGLGLPMAKAIVDKNEGRLRVESEVGRGTCFTIRLRAATADLVDTHQLDR